MLVATIENIVLSIILGKILGIAGVIFASAISRLTTYCWYEPRLLYREYFDRTAGKYYFQILTNVLLCLVAIVSIGFIVSGMKVTGWVSFGVKGVIVGALSFLIFMGIYFRTEGAQNIIKKIREKLVR
jgi:peptidoglycan biosynthesis protein MviN/MurJ (putative lipid II flippase)